MKPIRCLNLMTALMLLSAGCQNKKAFQIPEGHVGMFGYGSWELGYERFEVSANIADYSIEGGPVFAYRALPAFEKEPTGDYTYNTIEKSYTGIIQEAFDYWGKEFESEYRQSTEPVDSAIIRATGKALWVDPPLEMTRELKTKFEYPNR
jgi:hypothetical protein